MAGTHVRFSASSDDSLDTVELTLHDEQGAQQAQGQLDGVTALEVHPEQVWCAVGIVAPAAEEDMPAVGQPAQVAVRVGERDGAEGRARRGQAFGEQRHPALLPRQSVAGAQAVAEY